MLDDTSTKLRINVMVLGVLIILGTLFNAKITPEIGILKFEMPNELVGWLVVFAAQIYIFFRYWHDDETRKIRGLVKDRFYSLQNRGIKRFICSDIKNAILHETIPQTIKGTCQSYEDFINKIGDRDLAIRLNNRGKLRNVVVNCFDLNLININPNPGTLYHARISIDLTWKNANYQCEHIENQNFSPLISAYNMRKTKVSEFLILLTFSKISFDFFVPVFIAFTAAGISILHIVAAAGIPSIHKLISC